MDECLEGWINTWNGPGKGYVFISTIKDGDQIEEYYAHASDCLFPISPGVRGKWVRFVRSKAKGRNPVAERVRLLEMEEKETQKDFRVR